MSEQPKGLGPSSRISALFSAPCRNGSLGSRRIVLKVDEGFTDCRFDGVAVSLDLAYEHCALDGSDAEVCHPIFIGLLDESAACSLFDKECSELVFNNFKDEIQVQTD